LLTNDSTEEEVMQQYDEWAPVYDQMMQEPIYKLIRPFSKLFHATVSKLFPEMEKRAFKVLDVAAGTGLLGLELNKLGYSNIDALDISREMMNHARSKNVYKKFMYTAMTDQRTADIKTGEYDALTCSGAVGSAHVRPSAFDEMIRIFKPGGVLCFNISLVEDSKYEEKRKELEDAGKWKLACKEKVPFLEDDKLEETHLYIYVRYQ